MFNFNEADPGQPAPPGDAEGAPFWQKRRVDTAAIKAAVQGREADLLGLCGFTIPRRGDHAHCPYPGSNHTHGDRDASWRIMESGVVICTCRDAHSVFDAMIFKGVVSDFEEAKIKAAELLGRTDLISDPTTKPKRAKGLTLAVLAEAKKLPAEFLAQLGVADCQYKHAPAVRIPYLDEAGNALDPRFRVALTAKDKEKKILSEYRAKIALYGRNFREWIKGLGYAILVEGESCAWSCWYHQRPAIGVPGAGNFNDDRDSGFFDGIRIIYVLKEPGISGETFIRSLAKSKIADRCRYFELEAGDASDLHMKEPERFDEIFQAALDIAKPLPKHREIDKPIADYNKQFALVNEAGKPFVYTVQKEPTLGDREILVKSTTSDFVKLHANEFGFFQSTQKTDCVPKVWLSHIDRRQYLSGIILDPTNSVDASYWNLWRGFSVKDAEGDWSLLRSHILKVICSGNDSYFAYVMGWLARLVQHPELRGEVAIVLRGKRGVGKGKLVDWVMRLFGQHALQISNPQHLAGRFNSHLRDCILLFADEAFFAGDKAHQGTLQALITERTITIEPKNVDLQLAKNLLHVIMASNEDWIVPAGDRERRYCVLDVSDNRIQDHGYFAAIDDQMLSGGLAAMLFDLLNRDISGFEVREFPRTEALNDQQVRSLDNLSSWWVDVLKRGFILESRFGHDAFDGWPEDGFAATDLLYQSYERYCRKNNLRYLDSRISFGAWLSKIYSPKRPDGLHICGEVEVMPDRHGEPPTIIKSRPHGYRLDTLDDARAEFLSKRDLHVRWEEE